MIPTPKGAKICNIYILIFDMIPSPKVPEKVIYIVPTSKGLKYAIYRVPTPKESKYMSYMVPIKKPNLLPNLEGPKGPKCAIHMFPTQKVTK